MSKNSKVKLNQIIAVEKGAKSRTATDITTQYHLLQKSELMSGQIRNYTPLEDNGENSEKLPSESQLIQVNVLDILDRMIKNWVEYTDIVYTQEVGNTQAKADLVVDGETLMQDVPVTFLLRFEKALVDVQTAITKAPVYDLTENWTWNNDKRIWQSDNVETARTKKITSFVIAAQPTDKHPAQVKEVTKDIVVGSWSRIRLSATLSPQRKRELLDRVQKLIDATKFAREAANSLEIDQLKCGEKLFNWLFK